MREWLPAGEPSFIVFIHHGVAEHSERYDELAKSLTAIGARVVCQDHPGHGKTAEKQELPLGQFHFDNPMREIIETAKGLIENVLEEQPLPWVIMGHSMGTVIAQHTLQALKGSHPLDSLKGVILSGPPAVPSAVERLAFRGLLGAMIMFNRGNSVVRALTFEKYDKQIKSLTGMDGGKNQWLNSQADAVEAYNNDPLCGQDMSFTFWRSALIHIGELSSLDFTLPSRCNVLVIGGDMDAATNFAKSLDVVRDRLKLHAGCKAIEQIIFPGARHELIKERCKSEAIDQVVDWVERAVHGRKRSSL